MRNLLKFKQVFFSLVPHCFKVNLRKGVYNLINEGVDDMQTFIRYEKKYLLDKYKYESLMEKLSSRLKEDKYHKTTICNIYFDTDNFELIRHSLDKPVYKEKLRLRSYGVPKEDSLVFLELKKKYDGVVYKRRQIMKTSDAENYLYLGCKNIGDTQVIREIDWFINHYKSIKPRMYISYSRDAFCGVEDSNIRITFDHDIIWRERDLKLGRGIWGDLIIGEDDRLMEIKINGGMPIWLCRMLNDLKIYPTSFSKYGMAYRMREGHVPMKSTKVREMLEVV